MVAPVLMRKVAICPAVRPVVVANKVTPLSVSPAHEDVMVDTVCDVPLVSMTTASVESDNGVMVGTEERTFIGGNVKERRTVVFWQ